MLFPANPGRGLLLPFVGRSLAIPGAGPCRCCSPPILAGPAAGFGWLGRHSPLLAGVSVVLFPAIPGLGQLLALLVLVVPRHSRQRQGAGFGELGGPSPTLAEVPRQLLAAIPRSGRHLALVRSEVPRQTQWRALWVQFWAIPGSGLLRALVGWTVPRHPWRKAQWVLFAANPGFGPLLPLAGRSPLAIRCRGPCGCSSLPFLAGACCWGLVVLLVARRSRGRALWVPFPTNPGSAPILPFAGWVVPLHSLHTSLWLQFPPIPGWGLLACHSLLGLSAGLGAVGGPSTILVQVPG